MGINQFIEEVKRGVQLSLGDSASVSVNQIRKNNGVMLRGLVIVKKGVNVSPTIYVEDLYEEYQNGRSMETIVDTVCGIYEKNRLSGSVDMDFFFHYESVRGRLVYRVVNTEKNRALLGDVPHREFCDLSLVFYCALPEGRFKNGSILIHNSHLRMWGIPEETLLMDAAENTPRLFPAGILAMEELIGDIFQDGKKERAPGCGNAEGRRTDNLDGIEGLFMYVLTNDRKLFGASCVVYPGLLQEFATRLGCDLFILPSSVHEVILVPRFEEDVEEKARQLKSLVCEVNASQVDEEEKLSDSVYFYDRRKDALGLVV